MANGEFRMRVRYGKVGRLRWLSHLELIHALERSVRRAGLSYAITQGFSPHMKCAFGPALPVGTAGDNEYYDVWLTRYTDAKELFALLLSATPGDLAPTAVTYAADSEPSLSAALTIAKYSVEIGGKESSAEKVQAAIDRLVESGTLEVEHKGKHKVYDLAHGLPEETCVSDYEDGSKILLAIRIGPQGSIRPELLVRSALEAANLDASVLRVTRTDTLIENEGGLWARPM